MALTRFDYIVWSVAGALGLAILGVVALGDRVGVRVARTFPAEAGVVAASARIGLEFADAMNTDTVEARFSLEPPTEGRFEWRGRQMSFIPARGLRPGQAYTARLQPGAQNREGRETQQEWRWSFSVREPYIVYLSAETGGAREVWRVPAGGGARVPLTQTNGRVYDFAVARDGEQIVYSVVNEARGADLWLVDREGRNARMLVNCGADLCTTPAWSPDGGAPGSARIAYSREPAGLSPGSPNGPPRVWTVEVSSGQTASVYQSSQVLGYGPVWSPDGRRLAFFDGSAPGIRLLDVGSGEGMLISTPMGTVGSWSPDGEAMAYNDLNLETGQPQSTLARADFGSQTITPLVGQDATLSDFGAPVWSPDGEWLAVSVRTRDGGPSKQIWLLRPDGSERLPVTADPSYTFGGQRWNAAGDALVLQRFELNKPLATPEVLVWQRATNMVTLLAQGAATPEWMP
jgi:dipeptidyl aminopeptidase/acylaminoacyl peptidase